MKKLHTLLLALLITTSMFAHPLSNVLGMSKSDTTKAATGNIQPYKGKDYTFDANTAVLKCTALGKTLSDTVVAYSGYTFNVSGIEKTSGDLIIKFDFFLNEEFQTKYNVIDITAFKTGDTSNKKTNKLTSQNITNSNTQFFRLKKADFDNSCSEDPQRYSLTFGTFTTPFKFRPTKSLFTNNLSLGASVNYLHPYGSKGWAWGAVAGISLTSVTLDSLSTNYKIKTSTERPALTPSISGLIAYKNINFTLGIGVDYINKTSIIEQSWIFNGKPWIGFGIGLSLFSSSATTPTTPKSPDQSH